MWCSTKQQQTEPTQNTTQATPDNNTCKQAIAAYLQETKQTTDGAEVSKGSTLTVDYVGRLDEATVFDTSVESVAKACGKYTAGRNYNEGLAFTAGAGQMIAGFDKAVVGMKVGETKTIEIAPADAYGVRDEKKLITIPKSQAPEADTYQIGTQVMSQNGQSFKVYKITDTEITFDANHELAGKTLIFDITVKSIK